MRIFKDEDGNDVTEKQLQKEFIDLQKEQPEEYNYSFECYILNCTSKNGTLTEVQL